MMLANNHIFVKWEWNWNGSEF